MAIKLINIGFGNIVSANRIVAIIGPESAPVKRIIQEAREERRLIDATYGGVRAPSSLRTAAMWCFPRCSRRRSRTA